ncbi:zinc finger HIT-type containing 6 [Turdus rufiventris]|nr:zinc finger HIT-type containing 6 [Turdus rufiventris]
MSLHRCETCSKEEAKYRCPRCMKYSCSLLCVKKHKLALSCNGVRDKTAFVSVNEFTDLNLLSDYRFLEDVGRTADAAARHCIVHSPATKRLTKLRGNAQRKPRVPDDKTLADILKPYIDPVESDPVVCQRLKIYTASPQSDVRILMKIENRSRNSVRYNELDASRSLLDNLKGKVIIEYPTLFVVLKTLKNDMVVLGQDGSEPAENSDSESSSLSSVEEGEIRDST